MIKIYYQRNSKRKNDHFKIFYNKKLIGFFIKNFKNKSIYKKSKRIEENDILLFFYKNQQIYFCKSREEVIEKINIYKNFFI